MRWEWEWQKRVDEYSADFLCHLLQKVPQFSFGRNYKISRLDR